MVNNSRNCTLTDSKYSSQLCLALIRVPSSYINNLIDCYFMGSNRFTASGSTLNKLVELIIGLTSNPKMIWVHAQRIIACVAHTFGFGYFAKVYNPSRSMGVYFLSQSFMATGFRNNPISIFIYAGQPIPASIGFFKLGVESLHEVVRKTLRIQEVYRSMCLHCNLWLRCHASGCSNIAEALYCTLNKGGVKCQ
jgi:hypothetical protein